MSLYIYNPLKKNIEELPTIYGFNNGGPLGLYSAQLIAEDGTLLGGHACSSEIFMLLDLGLVEESHRKDRQENFKKHYPDGFKTEFVTYKEVREHKGLWEAFKNLDEKEENSNEEH